MAASETLTALSLHDLAHSIARREVSPVEATEAYLARIERLNPSLNAYISVYPEQALEAARQAEATLDAGGPLGSLHGVPVAVKDLFAVRGMARTCGSSVQVETAPEEEATAVTRLREAGAVVLGMLNLHEFAYGPTGINPHHGTARNPWNTDYVCGGSSSGSGCATAARLAAATLGTDTGGSIRIPASLCGVVGFKQTYGLVSRRGIFPVSSTLDHGGPLARTVRGAALMLKAIAGTDALDSTTRDAWVGDFTAGFRTDLDGVRVGVPRAFFFDGLHPDTARAVETALGVLSGLGAEVRELAFPQAEEIPAVWNTLCLPEAYAAHEHLLSTQPGKYGADVKERLRAGRGIEAKDYIQAVQRSKALRREMAKLLVGVDVLATPSCPMPGVRIETGTLEAGGVTYDGPTQLGRLTRLAPLTGQPAVSVPCGFSSEGLPIGLQLIGNWWEDAQLLGIAHAYEQATDWHRREPPGLDATA